MRRILKIVASVATIQLLMNIPAMAQSAPRILLIAREPLNPGAEAEYDRIESETAVLAVKLECPHPYLALQPLSGAKNEIWWFNLPTRPVAPTTRSIFFLPTANATTVSAFRWGTDDEVILRFSARSGVSSD